MGHKKNLLLGASLSLLSYFCLSSTNALVKMINGRVDSFQILLLQYGFGLLVIFSICLFSHRKLSFYKSDHYGLLFLRAIVGVGAFLFVFISVKYLPVANAVLLFNTGPFFIPFMLFLWTKERIDHRLWFGIIPGFIGIAFILNPGSGVFQWHAILPLISGVCLAVIYISLRRLHHHKEPTIRILFYLFLFCALMTLPFAVYNWKNPLPKDWIFLAFICITSFLSQTLITLSLRYGSPKAMAPLCYTSVIFALFFDGLIWHHIPSWASIVGTILIIVGGVIALLIENKAVKLKER
jgi:drug/metabolite transporter (DMT)-like permease